MNKEINKWFRLIISAGIVLFLFAGCATSGTVKVETDLLPRPGAKVVIDAVTNSTDQTFDFDIETKLFEALQEALTEEDLLADSHSAEPEFSLALKITKYEPGNAFKRWVMPGWGSTNLELEGELVEAISGNHVASIKQERSMVGGGFYTIGAWSYVIDNAAKDLAKFLKLKIEMGGGGESGGFIITADVRSNNTTEAKPSDNPIVVNVAAVEDMREERGREGERTAAFGVKMGDVCLNRRVDVYLMESLMDEIQLMGNKVAASSADVKVTPQLNKFWIYTDTTVLYWDVIAEIEINLLYEAPSKFPEPFIKEYKAIKTKRTYAWPSSILMSDVMNSSLDELFTQIRSDSIWESFRPDNNSNVPE